MKDCLACSEPFSRKMEALMYGFFPRLRSTVTCVIVGVVTSGVSHRKSVSSAAVRLSIPARTLGASEFLDTTLTIGTSRRKNMALQDPSELRDVLGIDQSEKNLIKAFLQGAVYCWVKNRKGEEFAARDLVGGENANWNGTPLQVLYVKHINQAKDHNAAVEAAAKDLGWLLKSVLAEDEREFVTSKSGMVNAYRWTQAKN